MRIELETEFLVKVVLHYVLYFCCTHFYKILNNPPPFHRTTDFLSFVVLPHGALSHVVISHMFRSRALNLNVLEDNAMSSFYVWTTNPSINRQKRGNFTLVQNGESLSVDLLCGNICFRHLFSELTVREYVSPRQGGLNLIFLKIFGSDQ